MQHKDLGRKADITGLREEETHSWNVRRRGEGGSTWNLLFPPRCAQKSLPLSPARLPCARRRGCDPVLSLRTRVCPVNPGQGGGCTAFLAGCGEAPCWEQTSSLLHGHHDTCTCRDLQVLRLCPPLPQECSAPSDPLKVVTTGECGHPGPNSLCVLEASRGDVVLNTTLVQGEKDRHTGSKHSGGSLCGRVSREKKIKRRTCCNAKRNNRHAEVERGPHIKLDKLREGLCGTLQLRDLEYPHRMVGN